MSEHHWVKMVITPIQVVDDPEISAEPVVFSTEADEIEAGECAQYGCLKCDEPLSHDSLRTQCEVTTSAAMDQSSQEE